MELIRIAFHDISLRSSMTAVLPAMERIELPEREKQSAAQQ